MTGESVLQQLDAMLATKGESLGYPKRAIFLGAWQGLSYEEMLDTWERDYDYSYIKAQGADLCKLLSRVLGLKVTKASFRLAVTEGLQRWQSPVEAEPPPKAVEPQDFMAENHLIDGQEVRWVERGDVAIDLGQRLQADCRLLFIVGLTGIGKTSLATRLMLDETLQQVWPDQHAIVLDQAMNTVDVLAHHLLGDHLLQDDTVQQQPDQLLVRIVQYLGEQPTLVVLDMVEEVLQSDGQGGHQFTDRQLEALLVRLLKAEDMPSRIILTSQERPPTLAEGRYDRRLHLETLTGLTADQALQLFAQWEIIPQADDETAILLRLITLYEGHPLALRVIAGEMAVDYASNIQDYWQDYQADLDERQPILLLDSYSIPLAEKVKTRIERTFDRLSHAEPLACRLLCMASKMREPTEREAWLYLLCDYPREEALWAFQTLQRRFLLETQPTRRRHRLHSLIRRIAYAHLCQFTPEAHVHC